MKESGIAKHVRVLASMREDAAGMDTRRSTAMRGAWAEAYATGYRAALHDAYRDAVAALRDEREGVS